MASRTDLVLLYGFPLVEVQLTLPVRLGDPALTVDRWLEQEVTEDEQLVRYYHPNLPLNLDFGGYIGVLVTCQPDIARRTQPGLLVTTDAEPRRLRPLGVEKTAHIDPAVRATIARLHEQLQPRAPVGVYAYVAYTDLL